MRLVQRARPPLTPRSGVVVVVPWLRPMPFITRISRSSPVWSRTAPVRIIGRNSRSRASSSRRGQARGDAAHPVIDIVVALAFREGGKLRLEILRVLAGDRRRLDRAAGTDAMTRDAGGQAACDIAFR